MAPRKCRSPLITTLRAQCDDAVSRRLTPVCSARRGVFLDMFVKQLHRLATQQAIPAHRTLGKAWLSALSPQTDSPPREIFRTSESDPERHTEQHEGQFYTISEQDITATFPQGLPNRYHRQCKTFNEYCLMVRRPALELIGCLKNADYSQPAIRYVLYGKRGSGKSLTLCHTLHYCNRQGWLLLQVPDAHTLVKNCKELMPSSYKDNRIDQPFESSTWLKNFKASNEHFLKQIHTQQRYVWSKRDATEEGRPLGEVVDLGIVRVKSASDAVAVVWKELKRQSGTGAYRLLVCVDGVNALWGRTTLKKEDKSMVSSDDLTMVHNLRKLLKNDWTGGAVIASVNQTGSLYNNKFLYKPHELLGKDGFEALDPFVPIHVHNYNEKEFESCYQYYLERNWIQHEQARTAEGKKEILFMCNRNPREMDKICAFL